jgi:hypothetical protein
LIDPIEDKAEIELKDSKTTKRNKKNENPLKKIVFIVGSVQKNAHFIRAILESMSESFLFCFVIY